MQTHGGQLAAKHIEGVERQFVNVVKVDWTGAGEEQPLYDISEYIEDVAVDRSLTGSLPSELFLVEGGGAAEVTITIGGEYDGMSMASVFSPYNGLSLFYDETIVGAEIAWQLYVETDEGLVYYPQFVGNVRTITPDRASGTVEITALDRVEKLRKPIQIPTFALSEYWESRGVYWNQLIDNSWMIDHCLRFCGVSQTPYVPSQHELEITRKDTGGIGVFVTNAGAVAPSLGAMDFMRHPFHRFPPDTVDMYRYENERHPAFTPGDGERPLLINGTENFDTAEHRYYGADRLEMGLDGGYEFAFNLPLTTPAASVIWTNNETKIFHQRLGESYAFEVSTVNGKLKAELLGLFGNDYSQVVYSDDLPTDQSFALVDIVLNISAPSEIGIAVNGEDPFGLQEIQSPPQYDATDDLRGLTILHNYFPVADFITLLRPFTLVSNGLYVLDEATYGAQLDQALNRLVATPRDKNKQAWDWITQAAASEFGAVFWDEQGRFNFWNLYTMLLKQDNPVRTFSPDILQNLPTTRTLDSIRNNWAVEQRKHRSGHGNAYDSKDINEFYVPARSTRRFRVWSPNVCYPHPYKLTRYTTDVKDDPYNGNYPQWDDNVYEGYVVQFYDYDNSGGWYEEDSLISGVDILPTIDHDGFLVFDIYNGYQNDARFATDGERPALRVGGSVATEYPSPTEYVRSESSIEKYGTLSLSLGGFYYQDSYSQDRIIGPLIERTAEPIPVADSITIPGDPRLQLGDTIDVDDPGGVGYIKLQIHGINRSYTLTEGLRDTLLVEIVRPPGVGQWDHYYYGRWDQSFIWSE